eukprot:CAMPEP_0170179880 /NCGR_PEP_ID=MMETSP0040_2-20121228/19675_1 /TAXON_ID=641309 /ORGANISM="Lotharella oceanica, Strain CCMP622" /LENGTH=162 /DNA_ID=CAMNT_0010424247 /DNA_START=46 /DNA_END=534 /DNA_ORIENTATION=+
MASTSSSTESAGCATDGLSMRTSDGHPRSCSALIRGALSGSFDVVRDVLESTRGNLNLHLVRELIQELRSRSQLVTSDQDTYKAMTTYLLQHYQQQVVERFDRDSKGGSDSAVKTISFQRPCRKWASKNYPRALHVLVCMDEDDQSRSSSLPSPDEVKSSWK